MAAPSSRKSAEGQGAQQAAGEQADEAAAADSPAGSKGPARALSHSPSAGAASMLVVRGLLHVWLGSAQPTSYICCSKLVR